jgi:tetratricopeptide (TPR) repeat protein/HEAT repeat protein
MRFRSLVFLALASLVGIGAARADFDPSGKKKPKKPPVVVPTGKKPPVVKPPASGSASASTAPEDTAPKKDPIKKAAIIAIARPGEAGPVLKLAQLYRDRDGNLDKGIAEWKARSTDTTTPADEQWGSLMTYAGLLKQDKRDKEAIAAYEQAIAQKPDKAIALVALARLKQDANDLKGAAVLYEKALPLHKEKVEKEATLRSLMELSIDLKDHEAAKKWHNELVKTNGDSMAVRAELARSYYLKNQFEQAEIEYQIVVKAASGDNRVLAPALLDLGICQIKLQKYDEAVKTLRNGLGVAGAEAGVKPRLLNAMAEAYRAQNKIEEFVAELEKDNPGDVDRQELLGRLAAEFDADKAIKWLTKALASAPSHVDTRVLLIRLLKEQSKIDEAIKQYEQLINHAKGQPQFVFDLCDVLIGRGEKPKCMGKLKTLENSGDPDVLQRLAAYYSQIGEDKLALALMEKLAGQGENDPSYIVDLGDYYYQRNNTPKAKEIWKKLLVIIKPKAKGLAALGEVYLDHDLGEDALDVYKQAVDLTPGDIVMQKGYAVALERVHKYGEAQGIWESILKRNDVDKLVRREARTHLVLLWLAQKKLEQQIAPLTAAFKGPPVDLESGRLVAEVQLHLRRYADAEATLRAIIKEAPGDVDARLVLERVLVNQGKIVEAIAILEELVKADPKGARQYYTRLAAYALQIYKDEEAIRYAAAAVSLSPQDADAHKKLAEMYRSQQDFPSAIKEFKLAIQNNPKLWAVYFELAELLLAQGEEVEADQLYRRVMRGSTDDELVANAIRFSAAINQKRGTLEVLETELLPIALGSPQKTVYRRLLVEVYANLTAPLIYQVKLGGPDANVAHAKLLKIGARGVQPLIDALSDADLTQQKTAIEILAFVENRTAGAPLFTYATGTSGDVTLRARAMVACGALRDPALIPKYETFLFPKAGPRPTDAVGTAAAWGLSRIDDKKATPLALRLVDALEALPPEMRVFAVLHLAKTRDKAHVPVLEAFLKRSDAGPNGRAAALYALGEIGDPSTRPIVNAVVETSTNPIERRAAILALARMMVQPGKGKKGAPVAANDPLVTTFAETSIDGSPDPRLRRAATIALAVLAAGEFRGVAEPMPVPETTLSAEASINALVPTAYGPNDLGAALVAFEKPITSAVATALQTSKDRSVVVLEAMLARPNGPALGTFTEGIVAPKNGPSAPLDAAARVADAAEPFVSGLVHHPDLSVQKLAVRWLGRRETKAAREALVDATTDASSDVQRLAIEELSVRGDATSVGPLATLLATHKTWSIRADAARALGDIGKRDSKAAIVLPLQKAATSDPYAFVRETALRALATSGRPEAKATLATAAKSDAEPRVREVATSLLAAPSK